jgi:hypothetical protein
LHRAILLERTTCDRLIENGLSFSIGVLSSLVATLLLKLWTAPPVSEAEAKAMGLDRKQ